MWWAKNVLFGLFKARKQRVKGPPVAVFSSAHRQIEEQKVRNPFHTVYNFLATWAWGGAMFNAHCFLLGIFRFPFRKPPRTFNARTVTPRSNLWSRAFVYGPRKISFVVRFRVRLRKNFPTHPSPPQLTFVVP